VDAAIAAQAVICVALPQAAGLGGDMLGLVYREGVVEAVNGTGRSPQHMVRPPDITGGGSVTVPGLVHGWVTAHSRWGALPLSRILAPAIRLADEGIAVTESLARAVSQQIARLTHGGAGNWDLLRIALSDDSTVRWRQPRLANLLREIAENGADGFYAGDAASAIVRACAEHGGTLSVTDLREHTTEMPAPIDTTWDGHRIVVQPPSSQGVLLAVALQAVERVTVDGVTPDDHVLVEAVNFAFQLRSECHLGAALLDVPAELDLETASNRGGPRGYLHTAGVAVADGSGQVVSSLVSVFDDFGSGVFVPELGIVLNNRAAGFTDGKNGPAPGKRPVHTLAPAMRVGSEPGDVLALATPGADGQVQTLLQVLAAQRRGIGLAEAVALPRWRSEDGNLLLEEGHPRRDELVSRGHHVSIRPEGDEVFGAVVAAGIRGGRVYAVADWRRACNAEGVD
jgi:gamma-glutamyltranspeptidase/glutathione hydrolase